MNPGHVVDRAKSVGEVESDVDRGRQRVGHEHDFVTDELDRAAAVRRDRVERHLLEVVDELRQPVDRHTLS